MYANHIQFVFYLDCSLSRLSFSNSFSWTVIHVSKYLLSRAFIISNKFSSPLRLLTIFSLINSNCPTDSNDLMPRLVSCREGPLHFSVCILWHSLGRSFVLVFFSSYYNFYSISHSRECLFSNLTSWLAD